MADDPRRVAELLSERRADLPGCAHLHHGWCLGSASVGDSEPAFGRLARVRLMVMSWFGQAADSVSGSRIATSHACLLAGSLKKAAQPTRFPAGSQ